ncbi:hypothetical protein AB3S75_030994 [Citrus x aurantiifolia]
MQRSIAQRLHWRSGYITNAGRATDDRCHMFGICFTIYFYHASVVALWSTLILARRKMKSATIKYFTNCKSLQGQSPA